MTLMKFIASNRCTQGASERQIEPQAIAQANRFTIRLSCADIMLPPLWVRVMSAKSQGFI
jgi:hypothetical protein